MWLYVTITRSDYIAAAAQLYNNSNATTIEVMMVETNNLSPMHTNSDFLYVII